MRAIIENMSRLLSVFKSLNDAGVRYVVVGGVATLLHGYVRMTADLDLAVDLDAPEATKAIRALTGQGFKPRIPVDPFQFADVKIRNQWVNDKGMQVFSLYDPSAFGLTVDLFAQQPLPFEALWTRSILMDVEGTPVRVCSIDDLIQMKRLAGRQKDLADIEQLEKIKRFGKGVNDDNTK